LTIYAPKKSSAKTLARKWNGGGPRGEKKKATLAYWKKVKLVLNSISP
jgi:hypothetical protein